MPDNAGRLLLLAVIILLMNNTSRAGTPDALPPCPATPNCVSSQATDREHHVDPLLYKGSVDTAMQHLQTVLSGLPRSTPVTQSATYLHFEVRSLIFRFVDDVECLADPAHHRIDIRSASRVGRSDFGVNRRRVEKIRTLFNQR